MIRLHMVNHQIIQRTARQCSGNIFIELTADRVIHCVKQNSLFVQQQIAVIGNATRNREQIFKPTQAAIASAHINKIILDLSDRVHRKKPPYYLDLLKLYHRFLFPSTLL